MIITILKGFAAIIALVLLPSLLIIVFSAEVLVGVWGFVLFLMFCYLIGLIVEEMED